MFCINCGAQILHNAKFCPACGAPVYKEPSADTAPQGQNQEVPRLSGDREISMAPSTPDRGQGPLTWYLEVLKKYAVFSGRAQRKEYWYFFLFNLLIGAALGFIEGMTGLFAASDSSVLANLYTVAVVIPGIAVSVRRLHDTDRSGWWLWIALVPFIGALVLLVFMVFDSHPGQNRYGPSPKAAGA